MSRAWPALQALVGEFIGLRRVIRRHAEPAFEEQRAADPIAAARVVTALPSIVSRGIDPLHATVVSVGALNAGKADTVSPALATPESLQMAPPGYDLKPMAW